MCVSVCVRVASKKHTHKHTVKVDCLHSVSGYLTADTKTATTCEYIDWVMCASMNEACMYECVCARLSLSAFDLKCV